MAFSDSAKYKGVGRPMLISLHALKLGNKLTH